MVFSFIGLPPTITSTALHNTPYTPRFQPFATVRRAHNARLTRRSEFSEIGSFPIRDQLLPNINRPVILNIRQRAGITSSLQNLNTNEPKMSGHRISTVALCWIGNKSNEGMGEK
jgi:hypothetical protein